MECKNRDALLQEVSVRALSVSAAQRRFTARGLCEQASSSVKPHTPRPGESLSRVDDRLR